MMAKFAKIHNMYSLQVTPPEVRGKGRAKKLSYRDIYECEL